MYTHIQVAVIIHLSWNINYSTVRAVYPGLEHNGHIQCQLYDENEGMLEEQVTKLDCKYNPPFLG